MRTLEFRVWDDESKEMVEGGVGIDVNGIAYVTNPLNDDFTYYPDCPIMQATGLKDKNGTEIYEGDIVCVAYYKYKLTWDDVSARFLAYPVRTGRTQQPNGVSLGKVRMTGKVIGNIYENPELLREKLLE